MTGNMQITCFFLIPIHIATSYDSFDYSWVFVVSFIMSHVFLNKFNEYILDLNISCGYSKILFKESWSICWGMRIFLQVIINFNMV